MEIITILLSIIGIAALIGTVVLWVMSIYYAATSESEEVKNSRAIWILLIVFTGMIGSIVLFFVIGKKREGILLIIATLAIPIILTTFAVVAFVGGAMLDANQEEIIKEWQMRAEEQGALLEGEMTEEDMQLLLDQLLPEEFAIPEEEVVAE